MLSSSRCCHQEVQGRKIKFEKLSEAWSVSFTWRGCNQDEVSQQFENEEIRSNYFQLPSCRLSWEGRRHLFD